MVLIVINNSVHLALAAAADKKRALGAKGKGTGAGHRGGINGELETGRKGDCRTPQRCAATPGTACQAERKSDQKQHDGLMTQVSAHGMFRSGRCLTGFAMQEGMADMLI